MVNNITKKTQDNLQPDYGLNILIYRARKSGIANSLFVVSDYERL